MKIGIPKEIKDLEGRVSLPPEAVDDLVRDGHEVLVEAEAGTAAGFPSVSYKAAGAKVLSSPEDVWLGSDLVVKVKEPLESEFAFLRTGLTLITYLHLAASESLTRRLLNSDCTAFGYETVADEFGSLPLLAPMSRIAGRLASQVAAHYLSSVDGGRGLLVGGIPGTPPAKVVILGAGEAGMNAADVAVSLGARVILVDIRPEQLVLAERALRQPLETVVARALSLPAMVQGADIVVGAVLQSGRRAPRIVSEEMVRSMPEGAVLVDLSIDQGGCSETSMPTSLSSPTYRKHGVLHYCVTNVPGSVPRTGSLALANSTYPYIKLLANGVDTALAQSSHLRNGLNIRGGAIVNEDVASVYQERI